MGIHRISVLVKNAFGTYITCFVVAVVQAVDTNAFGRRGVCKLSMANINAYMGHAITQCIEEDEIARLQLALAYCSTLLVLICGYTRQGYAHFLIYIFGEA